MPSRTPSTLLPAPLLLVRLLAAAVALLSVWSNEADAARWQIHRDAGLRAVADGNRGRAIEQFEAAIYYAHELPAEDREIGLLWDELATAYFNVAKYQRAWDAIARWDRLLAANASRNWAAEQQARRDLLTGRLFAVTREASGVTGGSASAPEAGPAAPAGPPAGATSPAAPKEPAEASAAPAVSPGVFAVHLASYRSEAAAHTGWSTLRSLYPALLDGKTLLLQEMDLGERGLFTRVLAVPFADGAAARATCAELMRREQYCRVIALD